MYAQKKQLLVVSSITYAYKARDFLFNKGIKCYIDRIPADLRKSGCGYGVKVERDGVLIAQMLDEASIHVKDIIDLV